MVSSIIKGTEVVAIVSGSRLWNVTGLVGLVGKLAVVASIHLTSTHLFTFLFIYSLVSPFSGGVHSLISSSIKTFHEAGTHRAGV